MAVLIGIRQSRAELDYILNHSSASALLYDASLAERLPLPAAVPSVRLRVWLREAHTADAGPGPQAAMAWDAFLASAPARDPVAADVDQQPPACIMYTSGTTG